MRVFHGILGRTSVTDREALVPALAADAPRGMQLTHVIVISHYT